MVRVRSSALYLAYIGWLWSFLRHPTAIQRLEITAAFALHPVLLYAYARALGDCRRCWNMIQINGSCARPYKKWAK